MIDVTEDWDQPTGFGGSGSLGPTRRARVKLPAGAMRRTIWIGAHCFSVEAATDNWSLLGNAILYRKTFEVGRILINRGDNGVLVNNIKQTTFLETGGAAPSLIVRDSTAQGLAWNTFQAEIVPYVFENLDIDEIVLQIDRMDVFRTSASPNATFCFGIRVLSNG